jgi:hypothetical protein
MRIRIVNVGPKLVRVELPITKHILITEHFKIFSSSLNQIEQILCHVQIGGPQMVFEHQRYKGATQKTQKRMRDSLFQFF